jgi:hypothetical protein
MRRRLPLVFFWSIMFSRASSAIRKKNGNKFEYRNPKAAPRTETNSNDLKRKHEIRSTKLETNSNDQTNAMFQTRCFGFGVLNFPDLGFI